MKNIIYILLILPLVVCGQYSEKKSNFFYQKPDSLSGDNLVAAYNMKYEAGAVLEDISGNGNDGTIYGAQPTKDGLRFDGKNDCEIPAINFSEDTNDIPLTFLCRLQYGGTGIYQPIMSKGPGVNTKCYYFGFYNDQLILWLYSNDYTGGLENRIVVMTDDSYGDGLYNFATTYDGSKTGEGIKIYVNGELAETTIAAEDSYEYMKSNSLATKISKFSSSYLKNSEIEDIQIYNRVLSEDEIKAWHNSYATKRLFSETYKFDEVGSNKPIGWKIESGTFEIKEMTESYGNMNIGDNYLECTSDGSISYHVDLDDYEDNGYLRYGYYTIYTPEGYEWATSSGVVDELPAWISYADKKLTITLSTGQSVGHLLIQQGEEQ